MPCLLIADDHPLFCVRSLGDFFATPLDSRATQGVQHVVHIVIRNSSTDAVEKRRWLTRVLQTPPPSVHG
jgi:hypothetical protein